MNIEKLNMKQLVFIENIKEQYNLKDYEIDNFDDVIFTQSKNFKNFCIMYNINNYMISLYSISISLKFEKYEDLIEIVDMLYYANNIKIVKIKNFTLNKNFNINNIDNHNICFVVKKNINTIFITKNEKIIKFKAIYTYGSVYKEIDRKVRNV